MQIRAGPSKRSRWSITKKVIHPPSSCHSFRVKVAPELFLAARIESGPAYDDAPVWVDQCTLAWDCDTSHMGHLDHGFPCRSRRRRIGLSRISEFEGNAR